MQPQQSHVSSTGLYGLRKTWQFLVDQICNNLASEAGSLHLVPVGGMLYIRQETSNPNFPFRQESGGGLGPSDRACILPHSPASCLPARPATPLYPADSTESPSTQLLLVKVKEQRRRSSCSITRARHALATRAAVTTYMLQHAQSWWPSEGAAEAAAWWLVGAAVLAGLCHQLLGAVLPACSL